MMMGVRSHAKAFSLLSRIGQVLGMLVVLAAILTIFYLRHTGWDHPLAKLFGAYKYNIATLSDYVEYRRGANRFIDKPHPRPIRKRHKIGFPISLSKYGDLTVWMTLGWSGPGESGGVTSTFPARRQQLRHDARSAEYR